MKIGNKIIGKGNPVFIIAEVGVDHKGDFEKAQKLIEEAKKFEEDDIKRRASMDARNHLENSLYILSNRLKDDIVRAKVDPAQLKEMDMEYQTATDILRQDLQTIGTYITHREKIENMIKEDEKFKAMIDDLIVKTKK